MTGYESKRAAAQDKLEQWDNEALKLALEQNFCPRCGKRTKDIHTCTPPQEKNNG